MSRFDILFQYIDLLSKDEYGKRIVDTESKGTIEDPVHFPYVLYSRTVDAFVQAVHDCWKEFEPQDYLQVLKSHNIEWNYDSMIGVDVTRLPTQAILALLLAAVRAEKFCDGALLDFLKMGSIQKWLVTLKEKCRSEDEMKIKLNDLLQLSLSNKNKVKVKFNQDDGIENPVELYLSDPDIINSQWLFWRNKQRYFNVGQIAICLLKLSYDTWLLTTIKRVTKELDVLDGVNYEGEELAEYRQYFGRVIIKYHKTVQTQGMFYNTVCDEMEVLEVLPSAFDGDEFPGYDKVRLSYAQLKLIVDRRKKSWIAALENQKAVYLITDKKSGKLYVGSATSDNGMLLARWSDYVGNGHGGNSRLKKLVQEQGFPYVKQYFQYSILENYNAKIDDKVILEREAWWKEILQSRSFGYNDN